jgi:hypothetical protein
MLVLAESQPGGWRLLAEYLLWTLQCSVLWLTLRHPSTSHLLASKAKREHAKVHARREVEHRGRGYSARPARARGG